MSVMDKQISVPAPLRTARRMRRPASAKKRIKTVITLFVIAVLSAVAVGVIYLIFLFMQVRSNLPPLATIGNYRPAEQTKIYYADGPLMAILATENRRPVELSAISPFLIDATIAIEDSRFYEHKGVDYQGIARALYRNVAGGNLHGEGASTITQQLARNISELGLTREKRLRRKIAEAITAVRIEQTFSKNEVLKFYLNQINYGNGAYGAEAAARAYFHKSAKKLALSEAAFLAGIPQRPSYFSKNRDAAYHRRDLVLDRMLDTGKITQQQRDEARQQKLKIYKATPSGTRVFGSPYVVDHVVGRLVREYGYDAVYSGWKIYTTFDSKIQKEAEKALRQGIRKYGEYANQGALVCLEPKTGYVRAMVGGLDYKRDQFNAITQGKRQPGSAFKPIVYTAFLDSDTGTLESTFTDDANFPGRRSGEKWSPKNYSGKYSYGSVTILSAIKKSLNTIAVKAAMATGIRNVIGYAQRMGISSELAPYAPLALGASAVRPIELCSAYSLFANNGQRAIPMTVTRVIAANGDVIEENYVQMDDPHLRPETLEAMNMALREVVLHGTGTACAVVPEARGKTGTTSDSIDAWFAGYTPELATVLWVAREQRDKKGHVVKYLEMPGATGGHLCAPIWRDFMLQAVPRQIAVNKAAAPPIVKALQKRADDKPKPAEPGAETTPPEAPTTPGTTTLPQPTDTLDAPPATTPSDAGPSPDPQASARPSTGFLPHPALSVNAAVQLTSTAAPAGPTESTGRPSAPPLQRTSLGATTPLRLSESSARPLVSARRAANSDSGPRFSEPSGHLSTPRADPRNEYVSVSLCADSMRRATSYCEATVERRMRRRDIPGPCRTHRPPPGEGN